MAQEGWLYFAGDADELRVVKAGWSADWSTRMNVLQSGYPFTLRPLLVIPGTLEEEARILRRLEKYKTKPGTGEWFRAAPTVLALIDYLAGRYNDAEARDFGRFADLRGRPNQLDRAVRLASARLITRA